MDFKGRRVHTFGGFERGKLNLLVVRRAVCYCGGAVCGNLAVAIERVNIVACVSADSPTAAAFCACQKPLVLSFLLGNIRLVGKYMTRNSMNKYFEITLEPRTYLLRLY